MSFGAGGPEDALGTAGGRGDGEKGRDGEFCPLSVVRCCKTKRHEIQTFRNSKLLGFTPEFWILTPGSLLYAPCLLRDDRNNKELQYD
jgi:hypothetical protein